MCWRAIFSLLAASLSLAFFAAPASATTTIDITYTGTATGSWEGNYSPFGPPEQGSGASGSLGSTTFSVSFGFSIPDNFVALPSGFTGLAGGGNFTVTASFTSPIFSSSIVYGENITASDFASTGNTSQSVNQPYISRIPSSGINVNAYSSDIPGSIFSNFEIDSGLTGSGEAYFGYSDVAYGGGIIGFSLDPSAVSVTVLSDAVPEPASWTMMIIGFFGLGIMACRRKSGAMRLA
jgi:hypothetical protein